ncbi:MAG: hypothetical protein QNK87_05620 [Octadecabacter sp.]
MGRIGDLGHSPTRSIQITPVVPDCVPALHHWNGIETLPDSAKDYETFHAGLYALDLFVPLDAFG